MPRLSARTLNGPSACQLAGGKGIGCCRTDEIVSTMSELRRERFETVIRLVGEPLRQYAARRTDADSAQDAVADAFLVIWRRLDDVPPGGELPWCYAVARNCLANAERSRRRQHGLLTRIARMDPPHSTEDCAPDPPDPALHRALRQLSADDRELLRLWAWEDLRPNEIAVILDTTANAVNIRLHRARKRLAQVLEADSGKPPPAPGHMQVPERSDP